MSKAFTRESDDESDPAPLPPRAPLPFGAKNYITPAGAQRLRDELEELRRQSGSSQIRSRDARLRQLMEIVPTLVISEPPAHEHDMVRFGATVRLRRQNEEAEYRIVGVDEADLDRNEISWLSPLARALIGRRAGETVRFRSPAGDEQIAILEVSY